MTFAAGQPIVVDQLRTRLTRMSDEQLAHFGRSAAYMCTPHASRWLPPLESFVVQLREARAEWRRRLEVALTG
jgi:hypothetical protein